MMLGNAMESYNKDPSILIYNIDNSIRTILDKNNIAVVGKPVRQRMINACLSNPKVIKGDWTIDDLEMIIECELF